MERNHSIDSLKCIMAFLIVLLHTKWAFNYYAEPITRCAVPCFMLISGYMMADADENRLKKGINKNYVNIDQYAKVLRDKAIGYFDSEEELTNYIVEVCYIQRYHQSKSFAWCVFGDFLIRNLMRNTHQPVTIPMKDDKGDFEYLFNKYSLQEVCVDRSDL